MLFKIKHVRQPIIHFSYTR